ncbi:ribonuclease Z [Paenibacillus mucilaginosus]|uniref:ribonuclease Z n=1 Tax=Paenibacillus mucilaginosus TaxID=61624 RepID=UPI001651042A|nr:ribonuclease Z [Paenibacillus mucilaginosus]MCG7215479.1 ribonuclease Z [Paenibacillus mucilaginosus]WDM30492.1 ribonuclease Z [Paenibacillus mucilaginosus]
MKVELYFLGTGAGMPSKERNVTSVMLGLLAERGVYWMFDCGEGTQHQVLRAPVKIGKLEKLFITHLHGDHLYGLPGLMSSRSYQGGDTPFTIYGPKGIREFVETSLRISDSHLGYQTTIIELEPEEQVVFEDDQFVVSAAPLVHRIESFGYRIVEKPQKGRLDAERLKSLGIAFGPLFGKIKNGEDVELPDGTKLKAEEFIGPMIPGRIVTILGDTQPCVHAVTLSKDADVLVHEATFAEHRKELAVMYDHSTAIDAAKTAQEAGVGTLILTHISSRYQGEEADMLRDEARTVHEDTLLAHDHFRFEIRSSRQR